MFLSCALCARSYRDINMPIEMKYLDDGRGVIYIGEGIVTGEDIISANRQFFI